MFWELSLSGYEAVVFSGVKDNVSCDNDTCLEKTLDNGKKLPDCTKVKKYLPEAKLISRKVLTMVVQTRT